MSTTQQLNTEVISRSFIRHEIRSDDGAALIDEFFTNGDDHRFSVHCHPKSDAAISVHDLSSDGVAVNVGPYTIYMSTVQAADLATKVSE